MMCCLCCGLFICVVCFSFFFFKQKTAYEMRISDWSSDVCSSDLFALMQGALDADSGSLSIPAGWRIASVEQEITAHQRPAREFVMDGDEIGRASCRERVCQYV